MAWKNLTEDIEDMFSIMQVPVLREDNPDGGLSVCPFLFIDPEEARSRQAKYDAQPAHKLAKAAREKSRWQKPEVKLLRNASRQAAPEESRKRRAEYQAAYDADPARKAAKAARDKIRWQERVNAKENKEVNGE